MALIDTMNTAWQSAPTRLCVNFYEPDLIDDAWETRIKDGLEFGKAQLGLQVPLNAMVVDQKRRFSCYPDSDGQRCV